ncbi:ATP-binding protein [Kitasatospora brasiliensis]|uniref:ATP-binding protein n=1 Tax=Kitasatospora brasiliensis TaxID=3058040 RepID=UPI0029318BFA|nr:AAA family ATPase [Kitasatospora sp. K002]
MLCERETELRAVADALDTAAARGSSLTVVTGAWGAGRTELLDHLPRLAEQRGARVLRADAARPEREFPYGVVRQLLEPALAGAASRERWLGADAEAVRTVLAEEAPAPEDGAHPRLLRELRALTARMAADQPLLIAVDDAHWADEASLRWLAYLARRPTARPVTVVLTLADGDPEAGTPLVRDLLAAAGRTLRLRPLSPRGTRALVERSFGEPADDAFVRACHEAAGGSPMVTAAIAHTLRRAGLRPVAECGERAARVSPPDLRERLALRLEQLPSPLPEFARAMAVLGDQAEPELLARLAELDAVGCRAAERALRALGLIRRRPGSPVPVFAHPVVRDAAEETATVEEQQRLHSRAAVLLLRAGHPAEQIAARLMATSPSAPSDAAWTVTVLRAAADAALDRGAPEDAVRFLRRALQEASPDGEDRAVVLVDLAGAERITDPWTAARHISQAVPLLPSAEQRAAALLRVSPLVFDTAPPQTVGLFREVFAALDPGRAASGAGREVALRLEARVRCAQPVAPGRLADSVRRLRELGPEPGLGTGAQRELVTVLLHDAVAAGGIAREEAVRLARQVLEREPALPELSYTALPLLAVTLVVADDLTDLAAWLETLLARAVRQRAVVSQVITGTELALVRLRSGDVAGALPLALEARRLAGEQWEADPAADLALAAVAVETMDAQLCDRLLAQDSGSAYGDLTDVRRGVAHRMLRGVRAFQRRDDATALDHFLACGRRLEREGRRNTVLGPWRTWAALAHRRLDDVRAAEELMREECERARAWGAPAELGRALRVHGTLAGGERGRGLLREAVDVLRVSHHRLELARALVRLGGLEAREGRPRAAELLREGAALADACGLPALSARARTLLGGPAPDPVRGLSPVQLTVARMVARGLPNGAIAGELGVSRRAVEKNLTAVYRKLAVRGRSELAGALRASGCG